MQNKGPYYITTAIAYAAGKPHIGNVYEIVLADAIARHKRETGYDVRFQTGTDEHGQKVEERAKKAGKTPKEFVDEVSGVIKEQFDCMNISYDHFIRTTDDYHERQVQKIFKRLYDKGDIYLKKASHLMCHVFQHSPVFRIGGDEFSVILQNDSFRDRENLIREFHKAMAETNAAAGNPWEQVNVSFGIAEYDAEQDGAVIDVVRRADKNMYENKRNRKMGKPEG